MKQLLVRQGQVVVEEVPAPKVEPGTVLVRAIYSCISVGTEMSTIQASDLPLWKRAQRQPEKVKKVLEMISRYGPAQTLDQVRGQLKSGVPIGYSAAGVVIEIGDGITDIAIRDRVACAGAQCAHHAEIIRVPRNLTVPIPTGLEDDAASTVALGAIALQAVRRAQPTLGETFVVIGLGILGQLTTQLLKINGCRVIGIDIDPPRISLAKGLGLDVGFSPADGPEIDQVYRLTDGIGADGVIVTAATASNEVISSAFNMCRKKGRVVLVGDVGLHINRKDIYEKELDFFISTSYGPGRYDRNFEEGGLDYPVGYVRWTEGRNMCEYLRLAAEGKLKVAPLLSATYPVDEAPAAYERLKNGRDKPLMVLLSYGDLADRQGSSRVVANPKAHALASGRVRIAIVGA